MLFGMVQWRGLSWVYIDRCQIMWVNTQMALSVCTLQRLYDCIQYVWPQWPWQRLLALCVVWRCIAVYCWTEPRLIISIGRRCVRALMSLMCGVGCVLSLRCDAVLYVWRVTVKLSVLVCGGRCSCELKCVSWRSMQCRLVCVQGTWQDTWCAGIRDSGQRSSDEHIPGHGSRQRHCAASTTTVKWLQVPLNVRVPASRQTGAMNGSCLPSPGICFLQIEILS